MSIPRRERKRAPTHPGAMVKLELEELGMSISEAARRLAVSRRTLSEVVNERRSISPEMALKLGRFFGDGTRIWLAMQMAHDVWKIEHDPAAVAEAEKIDAA